MGDLSKCIGKLLFVRVVHEISQDMPAVDVRLVQLNNNSILVQLISIYLYHSTSTARVGLKGQCGFGLVTL